METVRILVAIFAIGFGVLCVIGVVTEIITYIKDIKLEKVKKWKE